MICSRCRASGRKAPLHTPGLARGVRQRVGRRRHENALLNGVVDSLNSLNSGSRATCTGTATAAQAMSRDRLLAELRAVPKPPQSFLPHEASRALLGTCASYLGGGADHHLKPYDRDLVSLPSVGSLAPDAESLLGSGAAEVVRGFAEHMLLSGSEWEKVLEANEPITPYMDPKLKGDSSLYHQFVKYLFAANLIEFSDAPLDLVTPFFVEQRGK